MCAYRKREKSGSVGDFKYLTPGAIYRELITVERGDNAQAFSHHLSLIRGSFSPRPRCVFPATTTENGNENKKYRGLEPHPQPRRLF